MTTKLKGLTVVFENDIREDDAEKIILAIAQLRGVLSVGGIEQNTNDYLARTRIRQELTNKLFNALNEE